MHLNSFYPLVLNLELVRLISPRMMDHSRIWSGMLKAFHRTFRNRDRTLSFIEHTLARLVNQFLHQVVIVGVQVLILRPLVR